MIYLKSIVRAFKSNKKVLYKIVPIIAIVFSLTYLPHLLLVYMIRIACIGFIAMTWITLIYIGVKETQFRKKKHLNK